jgi:signal transduction histidine kinase
LLFFLCVLVPVFPLAYLALRSMAGDEEIITTTINEHLERVGTSFLRMASRPILDCETAFAESVRQDVPLNQLTAGLLKVAKLCPAFSSIFLLDSHLKPLYPFREAGDQTVDWILGTHPPPNIAEFSQAMRMGGRKEFIAREPAAALKEYRAALMHSHENITKSVALAAAARCCVKTENCRQALVFFNEILSRIDGDVFYNGLSMKLLAMYGSAITEKAVGNPAHTSELFLDIMTGLSTGELASNVYEASYYASMLQRQKKLLIGVIDIREDFDSDFDRAFNDWTNMRREALSMEMARDKFRIELQEALGDSPQSPLRLKTISKVVGGEDVILMCGLINVHGVAKPAIMAVLLDMREVRREVCRLLRGALETESEVNVTLLDSRGETVFQRGNSADNSRYVIHKAFAPMLPLWQLTLAYRKDGMLFEVAMRDRRTRLSYISLFILIICLGLYLTYRLVKKDSELLRLKSDFVSRVSHDLRTPLATIRAVGEMLEMGAVSDREKEKEYFSFITSESQRLSRLIDNVLDFSRISAGKRVYTIKPGDIAKTISNTTQAFRQYVKAEGFEIRYEEDDNLPVMLLDEDAISQALLNLMDNAVKFSRSEKIIWVALRRKGPEVVIGVRDKGVGIAPKELKMIFSQFYRADGGRVVSGKGTGIGLSIVKHIAEAHGGRVEAQSAPGEGSVFTIALPIERDTGEDETGNG